MLKLFVQTIWFLQNACLLFKKSGPLVCARQRVPSLDNQTDVGIVSLMSFAGRWHFTPDSMAPCCRVKLPSGSPRGGNELQEV